MSIIERAASLLRPVASAARERIEPAVEGAGDDAVIERAAAAVESQARVEPSWTRPRLAAADSQDVLEVDVAILRAKHVLTPDASRTPLAESFRRIKRHLLGNVTSWQQKSRTGTPANLVMVTSPMPGEGKTFCAINLAVSIAMELDRTVLLVDADVANPSILRMLEVNSSQPGLLDVLSGRRLPEALRRTSIDKLSLLSAGTPHNHATEMLASESMRALLREMAERYHDRVIIFDSPPLLMATESSVLAGQMGQILVVVAAGETTEAALSEALGRVEACDTVGLILNKSAASNPGGGYGYGYGYGYQQGPGHGGHS